MGAYPRLKIPNCTAFLHRRAILCRSSSVWPFSTRNTNANSVDTDRKERAERNFDFHGSRREAGSGSRVDENEHSLYALGWAIDHLIVPFLPDSPIKLVVVYAKPSPISVLGGVGPGTLEHSPRLSFQACMLPDFCLCARGSHSVTCLPIRESIS